MLPRPLPRKIQIPSHHASPRPGIEESRSYGLPIDSDEILNRFDHRIVKHQVVWSPFDIDDAVLAVAILACAIWFPIVEEYPEARAVSEKIATSDNAEAPGDPALWLTVAVGVVWVVKLGIQTARHVSSIVRYGKWEYGRTSNLTERVARVASTAIPLVSIRRIHFSRRQHCRRIKCCVQRPEPPAM
jgi:hypothetical protein